MYADSIRSFRWLRTCPGWIGGGEDCKGQKCGGVNDTWPDVCICFTGHRIKPKDVEKWLEILQPELCAADSAVLAATKETARWRVHTCHFRREDRYYDENVKQVKLKSGAQPSSNRVLDESDIALFGACVFSLF